MRDKLVPFRLLTPAGPETHEWSRTYRDLIFEMAFFVDRHGGEVTPQLVREFVAGRRGDGTIAGFSETEVGLLMRKAIDYDLPVRPRAARRRTPAEQDPLAR